MIRQPSKLPVDNPPEFSSPCLVGAKKTGAKSYVGRSELHCVGKDSRLLLNAMKNTGIDYAQHPRETPFPKGKPQNTNLAGPKHS